MKFAMDGVEVKVPDGIWNALPDVFPAVPKIRLVLVLVVMVPVSAEPSLTIGVLPFWKVRVRPLISRIPEVSVKDPLMTRLFPTITEPEVVLLTVKPLSKLLVPGVPASKNKDPKEPVPLMERFDDEEPVILLVADIPVTVPARFNVLFPILNLPEVNVIRPLIVGEPVKLNPPALSNSIFPN